MKLFIGCSSSNDILEKYINDCKNLLEILLKDNTLVFGASNLGLMGLSYNTAVNLGSDVIAVAPEAYKDGFKSLNCTKEILTKTVNNRTDRLILESDLILFLPGGIGTVYEFFLQ